MKVPRRACWQSEGTRWMCHMMVECRKPARRLWEAGRFASALARLRISIACVQTRKITSATS